jgi:hypothetical protein
MNGNHVSFGTNSGSIHILSIEDKKYSKILSFQQVTSPIDLISFYSSGHWLLFCSFEKLFLVENPLHNAVIFSSIKLGSAKASAIYWISEPHQKMNPNPFILLGDVSGGIWLIKHGKADCVQSINSQILQISKTEENFLINSLGGVAFFNGKEVHPLRLKKIQGEFGGTVAEELETITLSRPEGKLLFLGQMESQK